MTVEVCVSLGLHDRLWQWLDFPSHLQILPDRLLHWEVLSLRWRCTRREEHPSLATRFSDFWASRPMQSGNEATDLDFLPMALPGLMDVVSRISYASHPVDLWH